MRKLLLEADLVLRLKAKAGLIRPTSSLRWLRMGGCRKAARASAAAGVSTPSLLQDGHHGGVEGPLAAVFDLEGHPQAALHQAEAIAALGAGLGEDFARQGLHGRGLQTAVAGDVPGMGQDGGHEHARRASSGWAPARRAYPRAMFFKGT